jgi:sugar phosphate permease
MVSILTGATKTDDLNPADQGRTEADLENGIVRRVAWRLVPFLILCYVVAYLNRVNLSFAALQMNKDLGLSATAYGFGAGIFFLTYCLCEVPSNLFLHRIGARRWIARIMLTWGVVAVATAFIRGPYSFYAMRLLLGAAEAGFYPGVLYFLTLWFPAAHRGRIIALFLTAIPISGIIGAPLSGWLLTLDGLQGLRGWQWLYIIEGLPAIVLAPFVLWRIQDGPSQARWLPEPQRNRLASILDAETRAAENKRSYSIGQALFDPWVLFLAATYFTNVCLLNGITFFLPQIVKGFGLSNVQTGLVVAAPSVLALFALIWWGRRSDARKERYGHAALANMIGGLALLAAMILNDPAARIVAIAIAFAATLAFTAPFWAIPSSFLTGGAAAGGIAAISALGVCGGFIAPWVIGRLRDLTGDFRAGMALAAGLAIVVTIPFYFIGRGRRDAARPIAP